MPKDNYEEMLISKYVQGQQHRPHTNDIESRVEGPRILTVMLFLNDVPEDSGGETEFMFVKENDHPRSNVSIQPKRGMALLFPMVYNSNPTEEDICSTLSSKFLFYGVKHVAQVYVHLRDFKNADPQCM